MTLEIESVIILSGGEDMTESKQRYDYSSLLGLMKSKKLRQEDLAAKIRINPSTLSQKLNNQSEFTQGEMRKICNVLGVPLGDLSKYFFCSETLEKAS